MTVNPIPEIEFQSPEAILKLQEAKLRDAMAYLAQHSPFYIRHFERHNIDPRQITSIADLKKIPPVVKDDLQKHNDDFLCVPRNRIVEYSSTSGTLGKPVTIALTENDLKRLAYNECISFMCADSTPDDLFQLMLTLDRQFMAGMAYYEGIRKLGAGLVRVGPGLPALQWETIQRLKPTAMVAVPSFILKLIEFAKENHIDLTTTSIKKAICIGEPVRDATLGLNALGRKIQEAWDIPLYGTYASTEMQTAFTECAAGHGGHHHPELIMVEALDDQGLPVAPGEVGEITITTLGVEGMPLLRYRTGDMATLHHGPCTCGRNTLRVGPVVGRKQQMVKLKGTTLYPPGIFEIMGNIRPVRDLVVEAYSNALGLDELKLHLWVDGASPEEVGGLVRAAFQSRFRVLPELVFCTQREIEAMQMSGGRKAIKFMDRREYKR